MSDELTATDRPSAPTRAIKGFGSVYLRGRVWWIRYSHRGREYRESSRSEHEGTAWRRLKARWKEIGRGRFVGPSEDRITVNALLDALTTEYETNGRRSRATLPSRLAPLRAALGDMRAVDVTGAHVERYKADSLRGQEPPPRRPDRRAAPGGAGHGQPGAGGPPQGVSACGRAGTSDQRPGHSALTRAQRA